MLAPPPDRSVRPGRTTTKPRRKESRVTEFSTSHPRVPEVTNRATWQASIDELRIKEKAHTRAGDALAAERRRLPMVEVDPATKLIGADGRVNPIQPLGGRSQ